SHLPFTLPFIHFPYLDFSLLYADTSHHSPEATFRASYCVSLSTPRLQLHLALQTHPFHSHIFITSLWFLLKSILSQAHRSQPPTTTVISIFFVRSSTFHHFFL
ncbi:hypothetical protein V8G54_009538, partial [Vigna mungo]